MYTLGALQFDAGEAGDELFVQLRDAQINGNPMILQEHGAGCPDPMFITHMGSKPEITCKTTQVWGMLNSLITRSSGLIQAAPIQDADSNTVDLFFRREGFASTRDPDNSTVHARWRLTHGMVYWTRLRAAYQQLAELDLRIKPLSTDGTTSPLVFTGNNDYPAANEWQEGFTLGRVKLGATTIDGNLDLDIDPSIQTEEEGGDDALFDTFCAIGQRGTPKITLRGVHADWWSTYGGAGVSGALSFFLRKKTKDGSHVADATAEHVKGLCGYGKLVAENVAGQHNKRGEITLVYYPRVRYDNEALIAFSQSAIS